MCYCKFYCALVLCPHVNVNRRLKTNFHSSWREFLTFFHVRGKHSNVHNAYLKALKTTKKHLQYVFDKNVIDALNWNLNTTTLTCSDLDLYTYSILGYLTVSQNDWSTRLVVLALQFWFLKEANYLNKTHTRSLVGTVRNFS